MIQTVRVKTKTDIDKLGENLLTQIKNTFGIKEIKKIDTAKIYRLEGINKKTATFLAEKLLCEAITHTFSLNGFIVNGPSKRIEIAYKPGVMNPQVESILKSARDLGI